LMDGSIACVARRLASSAFRRQVSLSDDIRGGSSNAPRREEKPRRMTGLKTVMHGATQGSLNPSPTRSHSRANTSKLGQGITLSGMARFAQIAVVPSPGPSFCFAAGRGADANRALGHLCLGIVSGRLGHLESLDLSPFMVDTLKAPARPGLSLLFVYRRVPNQAASCCVGEVVMTGRPAGHGPKPRPVGEPTPRGSGRLRDPRFARFVSSDSIGGVSGILIPRFSLIHGQLLEASEPVPGAFLLLLCIGRCKPTAGACSDAHQCLSLSSLS